MKEESVRAKAMSVESATLRSRLEEASVQAVELKRRLSDREIVEKDIEVLRKECRDLRHLTTSQEQRLEHCQREAQQSQAEQASLEAILSLLHLREVSILPTTLSNYTLCVLSIHAIFCMLYMPHKTIVHPAYC